MWRRIGYWWNDSSIQLVEIDGTVYALNGWNGEAFLHSWICSGEDYMDASEEEYRIKPLYNENSVLEEFEIT